MVHRKVVCEYVSSGHPDKVADQISDALLDAFLAGDKNSRCGIETMVKDNIVVLGGEVNSSAKVDYDSVVRGVYERINYPASHHLNPENIKVINLIGKQSPEIHGGVDREDGIIGAGDQGFMVGYASNEEKDTYMPLGMYIAKKICDYVSNMEVDGMRVGPDTKTQVIVDYHEKGYVEVESILVSSMHQCGLNELRSAVKKAIRDNDMRMDESAFMYLCFEDLDITVNPCGSWEIGGSVSDCGVTGRKIVVDHYGGYSNVGGGAFSGKDMTKVDRSGAYMARYIAKNVVAAGLCDTAKVELSYMIGVPEPSSINIEMNRNKGLEKRIVRWLYDNLDLTPAGIIRRFNGREPRFEHTAREGHFGFNTYATTYRDIYPWEETDIAQKLLKDVE